MQKNYSQFKAMLSITKASLRASFRSPSTVIFTIGFPLIFILVFGFVGEGNGFSEDVALDKSSDTLNMVYAAIKSISVLNFKNKPDSLIKEDLEKGKIAAIIKIEKILRATQLTLFI